MVTNVLWESLDEAVDSFFSKHEDLEFVMVERSDHVELQIMRNNKGLVKCRFIPCQRGTTVTEEKLAKMLEPLL